MRLFIDQDVYGPTIVWLKRQNHDVIRAAEIGMARAPDLELLEYATREGRVLVTRDLDFGRLVHVAGGGSAPVIILRIEPLTQDAIHAELAVVLERHSAEELAGAIVVVEAGRHRIRRLLVQK